MLTVGSFPCVHFSWLKKQQQLSGGNGQLPEWWEQIVTAQLCSHASIDTNDIYK